MSSRAPASVYTISGFILPLTPYHAPYNEVNGLSESLFSKAFAATSDQMLRKFFKSNNIFVSDTARKLYDDYAHTPSTDNFMKIVDMVAETLREVTPVQFFCWQASSKHISNISLMMCKDLLSMEFLHTHTSYAVISANSRFCLNNSITTQQAATTNADFQNLLTRSSSSNSWTALLAPLMGNRAAFLTFFRHIFVDFY